MLGYIGLGKKQTHEDYVRRECIEKLIDIDVMLAVIAIIEEDGGGIDEKRR